MLIVLGRGGSLSVTAAAYGTVAGILFGVSSALTQSTLDYLHESVGTMLSHWECYALAMPGPAGSSSSRSHSARGLAPSVATVSVANPLVGILIGVLLLDETLSRPTWHIVVAMVGLGLALFGAVVISLAHEAAKEPTANEPTGEPVAAV